MTHFLIALAALIAGYFVYGAFVEKVFGADAGRATPCKTMADGQDYVQMSTPKVFLIQLLNIAGLGPVFGPLLGALYGPAALYWIVFGCIFAGATHDYLSGMLSVRYGGKSLPDVVGYNLGHTIKQIMRVFSIVLLVLVGVVFVAGPAGLLAKLTGVDTMIFVGLIFAYYFVATILPIDTIIGRLYPLFGALLVFMAVSLIVALAFNEKYEILPSANMEWRDASPRGAASPEAAADAKAAYVIAQKAADDAAAAARAAADSGAANADELKAAAEAATAAAAAAKKDAKPFLPVWPLVFITIACGACSGFHATQSPLMARCMANEKNGRFVFYGGMICEGIIGLIWVTLGMSFYPDAQALLAKTNPAIMVDEISRTLLGGFGGALAILGVVVLPITSGDTAFRASRLIIADWFNIKQDTARACLMLAIPLFAVGVALNFIPFNIIWRYFGWANQTLASIALWAGAAYLLHRGRFHWIASLPATFMTAVSTVYICYEPTMGFKMTYDAANIVGIGVALACFVAFMTVGRKAIEGEPANA